MQLTDYHAKYFAHELTRRFPPDSVEKLTGALVDADAALFAFRSPLSKGAVMVDEVGPDRTLLVLCTAFRTKPDRYPNLTVKKIPKAVLSRCEWGKDDYSLRVENLPKAPACALPHADRPPKPGQMSMFGEEAKG